MLILGLILGGLSASLVAALVFGAYRETHMDRSVWAEDLNDRQTRLRDLLNDCPVRRRPLVIDRDGRIIGGR